MKTKIAIYGIGGVGGFYAGKLAHKYYQSDSVEIYFIARGKNLNAITTQGLKVIDIDKTFMAYPTLATDSPASIGKMDYIIIATKSYDLTTAIKDIKPCIYQNTIILPLLNGGDITEKIKAKLPNTKVWSGCTYIVSRKIDAGTIQNFGTNSRIVFGSTQSENQQVLEFEKIMREANIDIKASYNIRNSIWKKFFIISVNASLTTYFDCTFNELVKNKRLDFMLNFGKEFLAIAKAENIDLGENPLERLIKNATQLPANTTSSMHSDFQLKHISEVDSLTGTIINLGKKHHIATPLYLKVYSTLKEKEATFKK